MDKEITIPELVTVCPICKGEGEYPQTYTAGCGMGTYRSVGPCDYCEVSYIFMKGAGYIYKDRKNHKGGIPKSVYVQMGLDK